MPVYVPVIAGLAATSLVGVAVFLYKNPELVDEVLQEVKSFFLTSMAKIEVKVRAGNEVIIREVDSTGRILREKIFKSQKNTEPPLTAAAPNNDSTSSSGPSSLDEEKRAFLNPEGYYSGRMPTPSSSGCTTPTSLRASEAGRDFESLRRRLGPESRSFYEGQTPENLQASSSGFARSAGEGVTGNNDYPDYFTEDGDEDIYAPPTHTKILQNIPLEYLEREIIRRKGGSSSIENSYHTVVPSSMSSSSATAPSSNPFADAFKAPDDDDDEPPSLPPKIPIGNDKTYTPQFSRRNSLTSEVSVSSSILSGSMASLSSSWQDVRTPTSIDNGLTDFLEYERQLRDNMSGLNYKPMAGGSILQGPTGSGYKAQAIQNLDTALSSEPSLVYSCPSSTTPSSSSHDLHETPKGDSKPEALTPVASRSSTLDCESVIYQDTSSESGDSNQSNRPRRHIH